MKFSNPSHDLHTHCVYITLGAQADSDSAHLAWPKPLPASQELESCGIVPWCQPEAWGQAVANLEPSHAMNFTPMTRHGIAARLRTQTARKAMSGAPQIHHHLRNHGQPPGYTVSVTGPPHSRPGDSQTLPDVLPRQADTRRAVRERENWCWRSTRCLRRQQDGSAR